MPKVLVLDDDTDLLEMVSLVLQSYQMEAVCISRGEALVHAIEKEQPDAVLMDIYLNASDGRLLCQGLKKNDSFKHIPVILYSAGHITRSSIQDSLADDFIVKPFDIAQLINKLRNVIPS